MPAELRPDTCAQANSCSWSWRCKQGLTIPGFQHFFDIENKALNPAQDLRVTQQVRAAAMISSTSLDERLRCGDQRMRRMMISFSRCGSLNRRTLGNPDDQFIAVKIVGVMRKAASARLVPCGGSNDFAD
jgi:hypothetical protein